MLNDVDVSGDGEKDQQIEYEASARANADIHIDSPFTREEPDGSTTQGRTVTDAHIVGAPMVAGFTLASPGENRTEVTYHAEERATSATIESDDGTSHFGATIENLPFTIEELSADSIPGETNLTYVADEIVDRVLLEANTDEDEFAVEVDDLPAEVGIQLQTPATESSPDVTRLEYGASSIVPHASITADQLLEAAPVPPATSPVLHRRTVAFNVDGVEPGTGLARSLEFKLDNDERTFEYIASDSIPEIGLVGSDEIPFFSRANEIDLGIEDLPLLASGKFVDDFLEFNAHGGQLGEVELIANSPGDEEALPSTEDGVLMRDFPDSYTLYGRVRGLRFARYVDHGSVAKSIDVDAAPPTGTDARVDVQSAIERAVWTNTVDDEDESVVRPGTEELNVFLRDYPADVNLELDGGTGARSSTTARPRPRDGSTSSRRPGTRAIRCL